jgi:prepilin-type N-terminal cleavage/methylation domain-containing protein
VRTHRPTGQAGFTLIEVLVAMFVLLVGVLGALTLVNRANATTSANQAREAATNLAREVIETARSVPYEKLAGASIASTLQSSPGLADASTNPGWQIRRRNYTFTVSVSSCVYDDPRDGVAATHDATFCADSATTPSVAGAPADKNPEDYKRVRADMTWTQRSVAREVHQVELINNPGSAGATAVRSLAPDTPTVNPVTSGTTANFILTTSSTPYTLHWLLDGASQGPVTNGSGNTWRFSWPLGNASDAGSVVDGTYVVSAEAFNQYGQAGASKSYTLTINRRAPERVTGVAGGRTADASAPHGDVVFIEWLPNRDLDITGYTVYRRDASGPVVVCPAPVKLQCVDRDPPDADSVHYYVVASDLDPVTLATRAGAAPPTDGSGDLVVTKGDTPPNPVEGLSGTADADGNVTLRWTRAAIADPDAGDSVDFYRIYRDGIAVGDPYARWDDNSSTVTWTDSNTGGARHSYWVTAVDNHYGESTPAGPVSP